MQIIPILEKNMKFAYKNRIDTYLYSKGFMTAEALSWAGNGDDIMEKILNLIMRGILGTIAMYFINSVLDNMGITLGVGINAATVLTSGILGFPGLLALYGIRIYKIL